MDSIYHIDTDLECKVFHYGREKCIAKPGEDVQLMLKKGKHKLMFQSTENKADAYSILFEVPESDLEDCIFVKLVEIRDCRLKGEADAERKRRETELKRIEEEKALELERQREKEWRLAEERKKAERIAREEERKQRDREEQERMALCLKKALEFAKDYEECVIMPIVEKERIMNQELYDTAIKEVLPYMTSEKEHDNQEYVTLRGKSGYVDRNLWQHLPGNGGYYSEGLRVIKGENGKYGYVDYDSNEVIECRYDRAFPFCYGLAHVVIRSEHMFINKKGEVAFKVEEYHSVNSFCQGVCICTELIRGGRWGTQLVGYDTNGYVVFRIDNFDSKASYCMDGIRETYKYENYFLHNSIIPVRGGFYNLSGEFHPMDKLRYPIYKPWTYKRVMPSTRGFEVLKDGKWIFMDEKGKEYPNEESLNTDIA